MALFKNLVNGAHEIDAEEFVRQQWSGKLITCSVAVSPLMGEYERTSTLLNGFTYKKIHNKTILKAKAKEVQWQH